MVDGTQHAESVAFGQLDVEEDERGPEVVDHGRSRSSVARFFGQFDPFPMSEEQILQAAAGDRLVLDDDGGRFHETTGIGNARRNVKARSVSPEAVRSASRSLASSTVGVVPAGIHQSARCGAS